MKAIYGVAAGIALGTAFLAKFYLDMKALMNPKPYVVVETGEERREKRPFDDMLLHLLYFKWRIYGDGKYFQRILSRLNKSFETWDISFEEQGLDAKQEVLKFCERWGVSLENWVWSKQPHEYKTMNEWFCRKYATEYSPQNNLGDSDVVMPATATVTWFPSVSNMPATLKNDSFTIEKVGIPNHEQYVPYACALLYLAPADYHCFHTPIAGKIVKCELLDQSRYSVTVKPYVLKNINILTRNRRAVVVIENDDGLRIALVIIGGVSVDSIRLENSFKEGKVVRKGEYIGCFARGGSSIAMFSNHEIVLEQNLLDIVRSSRNFKLSVGRSLAKLKSI